MVITLKGAYIFDNLFGLFTHFCLKPCPTKLRFRDKRTSICFIKGQMFLSIIGMWLKIVPIYIKQQQYIYIYKYIFGFPILTKIFFFLRNKMLSIKTNNFYPFLSVIIVQDANCDVVISYTGSVVNEAESSVKCSCNW